MLETAVIKTSPLVVMLRVYDSSMLPVVGFMMSAGSVAFCWSLIEWI